MGRIVIPQDLRTALGICPGEVLEFLVDEERKLVALRRPELGCVLCGHVEGPFRRYRRRKVCYRCLEQLRERLR